MDKFDGEGKARVDVPFVDILTDRRINMLHLNETVFKDNVLNTYLDICNGTDEGYPLDLSTSKARGMLLNFIHVFYSFGSVGLTRVVSVVGLAHN